MLSCWLTQQSGSILYFAIWTPGGAKHELWPFLDPCDSIANKHTHKISLLDVDVLSLYIVDPTKFFGCELGAQTQFDNKNERYIVNGAHDAAKLQELLDHFIKKFVLCPECDNPETHLVSINSFL